MHGGDVFTGIHPADAQHAAITEYLGEFNTAIAEGRDPTPPGPPLDPAEQARVERFLAVAQPKAFIPNAAAGLAIQLASQPHR